MPDQPDLTDIVPAHPHRQFDLASEPWIPVLDHDQAREVGIAEALRRAHELSLAPGDPLLRHALLRLLIALTYAAYSHAPDDPGWAAACQDGSPLPRQPIEGLLTRIADHLWLLHPNTPFLQQPFLRETMKARKAQGGRSALEESTVPLATIQPQVPTGNNPVWFNADLIDAPATWRDAAHAVLVRHVFALPGNEPSHAIRGGDKATCPGGTAMTRFSARGRSWITFSGRNLSQTLTANLSAPLCDRLTPDSRLFFEAHDALTAHLDDPLYVYTLSTAATYLVPHHGTFRVLRGPGQLRSKQQSDHLKDLLTTQDPHTLRVDSRSGTGTYSHIVFDPAAHQHEHLRQFLDFTADQDLHEPCLLSPHATQLRRGPAVTVATLDIAGAGQATGPTITAAQERLLDPTVFELDGPRQQALRILIDRIGASKGSVTQATASAVARALGDTRQIERLRPQIRNELYVQLEPVVQQAISQLQDGDELALELTDAQRQAFRDAAVDTYRRITAPYARAPRHRAALAQQLHRLRRDVWTL